MQESTKFGTLLHKIRPQKAAVGLPLKLELAVNLDIILLFQQHDAPRWDRRFQISTTGFS